MDASHCNVYFKVHNSDLFTAALFLRLHPALVSSAGTYFMYKCCFWLTVRCTVFQLLPP